MNLKYDDGLMPNYPPFTVCHIGAFYRNSIGYTTNADSLAAHLAEIGIDSICSSRFVSPLRRVPDMFYKMLRHAARYKVIVLHAYSNRAFLWAFSTAVIARLLGKKLVMWLHSGRFPAYYARHRRLVEFTLHRADHIIAPTGFLAGTFNHICEVGIMPYELPIQTYPCRIRTSARPKLLWLRAFRAGYNPSMAPRVIQLLGEDYPKVELVMCGPDKGDGSFQNTQQLAKDLGVADKISFPGLVPKERIKELGLEYDIFINTTNYDNTPVSVIEAMTMGMCVVSTNVGGLPHLVSHEKDGLLVPPHDPDAMAAACHQLLSDPILAQRLSHNAHQKAQTFDWKNTAPKWQALLGSLHFDNAD